MRSPVFEPICTPLEDDVPVSYTVVGSQKWFDTAFEPNAVALEDRLVISTPAQLKPIIDQARGMRFIGVDTETTGPYHPRDKAYSMNPVNKDCRIVILQIGNEDQVWIVDPAYIEDFRPVLQSKDQLHLAHNWEYDFKWLLVKNDIRPQRLYCSMLAEQLLTAGKVGYKVGLADCVRRYPPNWLISKAVRSLFIGLGNGKMTGDMVRYAARDIPILFPVFRGQLEALTKEGLMEVAGVEFKNIAVAAEMEAGGFHLNVDKLDLLIEYWKDRERSLAQDILTLYNAERKGTSSINSIIPQFRAVFNLDSNKKKLAALKEIVPHIGDVRRSSLLACNNPIATMLAEYSNVTKMTTTYGKNMKDKINRFTGLCHPRFAQMGSGSGGGDGRDNKETTATGRWVGDAQQFPRKSDGQYAYLDEAEEAEANAEFAELIAQADAKFAKEGEAT